MAMSPLWRKEKTEQSKLIFKRPSPKQTTKFQSLARGLYSLTPFLMIKHSIKGISLSTFFERKRQAGMTVEAAVVLPLFLLFFLNLSCAMEMIRLHGNLQLALQDVGNRLSVYGYAFKETDLQENVAGIVLSYGYVKEEMTKYAGEDYLDASPLAYGAEGLQFWESKALDDDGEFEINVTYLVSPWSDLAGFLPFRMGNRYYGHFWTGYEIPGASGEEKAQTVYVAENGRVYHESIGCSHLTLSVTETSPAEVLKLRNENGGRYSLCERCGTDKGGDAVFITSEGSRYHCRQDCPGLKRTIFSLIKTEAQKEFAPCSRCTK